MRAVYICASQQEPNVVKIGAVRKTTPEHRVRQQKCPFGSAPKLIEFFEVDIDPLMIESVAHKELSSRLLHGHEWFCATAHEARWSVIRAMKEIDRKRRCWRLKRGPVPLLDFGDKSYNWRRTWYGAEIAEMQRASFRETRARLRDARQSIAQSVLRISLTKAELLAEIERRLK